MQSAFVDIGLDSDAFLYVGDFLENLEDYDHVVTTVEGKVQKMEQQGGEVFATPAISEAPGQAPAAQTAPATDEGGQPGLDSRPAEVPTEADAPMPGQTEPEQQPFRANAPPPAAPFMRQERRPGGFGHNRNDRNDQGRRRGGRWRHGRGGPRQGRDLPPSKYASPRPYIPRPIGPPAEELPADFEPIILPGESLAKYKDRVPSSSGGASGLSNSSTLPEVAPPPADAGEFSEPTEDTGSVSAHESPKEDGASELRAEQPSWNVRDTSDQNPSAAQDTHTFSEYQALPEEPPRAIYEAPPGSSATAHDLSDEEVTSLAEQLAEARQEESSAQAEADADIGLLEEDSAHAPESAAETDEFIADAEAEEHDEHEHHEQHGVSESGSPGEEPHELHSENASELSEPGNSAAATAPERPLAARMSEPQRARFQRPMRRGGRNRGPQRNMGRPQQRREAPRKPQLISEVLKPGQEIIVQIAKEPLGKKGARITSHVALPGRFLVYMPTVNHIGVSRRISSADERSRLRRLVTDAKASFPGGFIVRTAADGAPDEEIRSDVEFLGRTWEKIRTQSEPRKSPALLHRDLNLVERILRDYVNNDYTAIWIDNEEEFSKVVDFVGRFQPKLIGRVKLYTKTSPIFEEFGIQQELDKALRPKVWLKSGGYIVINHTEALVAIDVNTGKYVGRGSTRLEDTIVKTNLEAVKEIIRQIRLRDLGGIIVLDFIDMEERRNREKVMGALEAALRGDRAPSKALAFNEFGLITITRKRTKQALERVLCQPCPYCTGSGMVKSVPTICYEIQAEARKMAGDLDASSLTLRVHPEIAKALKTREAALVEELEQLTRKSVIIQADPTLHWEQYDIY
jgi:ribonuclease G